LQYGSTVILCDHKQLMSHAPITQGRGIVMLATQEMHAMHAHTWMKGTVD